MAAPRGTARNAIRFQTGKKLASRNGVPPQSTTPLPGNLVQLFPPPDEVINPVLAIATNLIMGALNLPGEALVECRGGRF